MSVCVLLCFPFDMRRCGSYNVLRIRSKLSTEADLELTVTVMVTITINREMQNSLYFTAVLTEIVFIF